MDHALIVLQPVLGDAANLVSSGCSNVNSKQVLNCKGQLDVVGATGAHSTFRLHGVSPSPQRTGALAASQNFRVCHRPGGAFLRHRVRSEVVRVVSAPLQREGGGCGDSRGIIDVPLLLAHSQFRPQCSFRSWLWQSSVLACGLEP